MIKQSKLIPVLPCLTSVAAQDSGGVGDTSAAYSEMGKQQTASKDTDPEYTPEAEPSQDQGDIPIPPA